MSTASPLLASKIALRNILFATDLSPGSLLALPFAASIAQRYAGKLFLAHILPNEDYASVSSESRATLDRLESGAKEGLVGALGTLRNVDHEILTDHGSLRSRLLAVAEKCRVDLIVIGTHGWRGVKKLLRGSTAEEVACAASRPVLIVGPHVSTPPEFNHILYETDFSPMSARAIRMAFSLSETYDASLLCLHVNDWDSMEPPIAAASKTVEFFDEQVHRYRGSRLAERCKLRVEFGSRPERILHIAATHAIDLIIMGVPSSNGIRARIASHLPGSAAYDVVAEAACPLLTVPLRAMSASENQKNL
jgi:nucleotide-binding universal stress UspA family protein